MLTTDEIKDYFKLVNSHAKKELGQNFLISQYICENIVNLLDIKQEDKVLEVGPGLGALTGEMINKSDKYVAVEYDEKFVKFLENAYNGTNLVLENKNIVKFKDYDFNKIVGNLPYYMTTDILEYLTTRFPNLQIGVFMVQKECYQRLVAKTGKDYNAFNVFLAYLYDVKQCFLVNKTNFFPMPNVDSLVFKITMKQGKELGFARVLYKVAKILFNNRRKTVSNNLNSLIKNKDKTKQIILDSKIKENERAENLTQEDFVNLTNNLLNNGILKL
jgi:16S rRNA (adenine1518-N6/adenine1519-N6)-dimethyltransferase